MSEFASGGLGDTVSVLGAGSWGTALALLLARPPSPIATVRLWDRSVEQVEHLLSARENARYLPGHILPSVVSPTVSIADAVQGAMCIVVAVPSGGVRSVLMQAAPHIPPDCDIVLASKGLEMPSGCLPSEVARDVLGERYGIVALSGPNLAGEVVRDIPTAAVAACADLEAARRVRTRFNRPAFRVYTSADRSGVEIGGAVKNVLAIAGGVSDELGYGDNTKATLLTRGLAEMARLGVACGATRETFYGLAGMGDLMATAASRLSRNYRVGVALAQNKPLADILAELGQVAEGVTTAQALRALTARVGVEMPVCAAVARLLFDGTHPHEEVAALMGRDPKDEWEG